MTRQRAESEWADEHPDYDVESEAFVSHVFEMAQPISLWDVGVSSLEELRSQAPHRAYVVDVSSRLTRLVRVLRSLSVVEKLLSLEEFPIATPAGKIHRATRGRATSPPDVHYSDGVSVLAIGRQPSGSRGRAVPALASG